MSSLRRIYLLTFLFIIILFLIYIFIFLQMFQMRSLVLTCAVRLGNNLTLNVLQETNCACPDRLSLHAGRHECVSFSSHLR